MFVRSWLHTHQSLRVSRWSGLPPASVWKPLMAVPQRKFAREVAGVGETGDGQEGEGRRQREARESHRRVTVEPERVTARQWTRS